MQLCCIMVDSMNMTYKGLKSAILVILLALLVVGAACSVISTESWRDYFKPGHTKEEITKKFNLHGGRWWNYYARGRWYAEGGYYDEAILDFKRCIKVRSKDHSYARSYGMHFTEYFAHRELGIAYYSQGKYEDAKKALDTSLTTADSARAKFYLNKCNKALLKMAQSDQIPPQIRVTSHADGEVVNTPVVKLKGIAVSDRYVRDIMVQGKRLFVELAEKNLDFSEDVSLHAGKNIISLEARDLLGNSARQNFSLTLDTSPPMLYLDEIHTEKKDGKVVATVTGTIVDNYGVKSMKVNNTEIPLSPDREVNFKQDIVLSEGRKISFKVVDVAGNETEGEQEVEVKASLWQEDKFNNFSPASPPILVAATRLDGSIARAFLAAQDTNDSQLPPVVPLIRGEEPTDDTIPPVVRTCVKSAIVYDTNFFFSGDAHDEGKVVKLLVNQHPVDIRPAKHIFFNHMVTLSEGENVITIKAIDAQGNEAQLPPIKIIRKTFELLETDARYTVALLPLKISTEQGVPAETIYNKLIEAFNEDPKRFNFVESDLAKITELLKAQKIGNTELSSPETAVKVGKLRDVEGTLFGAVEEDAKGINVTLRLVDTETSHVLVNTDVYDEDKSVKNLKWLMYCLSLKMKQQFPIVQGSVIQVSGNGFHMNAGATSGVRIGMKVLLFRERKEGEFVLKERLETIAQVTQVQPETAFAKIISSNNTEKIEKKDFVITK